MWAVIRKSDGAIVDIQVSREAKAPAGARYVQGNFIREKDIGQVYSRGAVKHGSGKRRKLTIKK